MRGSGETLAHNLVNLADNKQVGISFLQRLFKWLHFIETYSKAWKIRLLTRQNNLHSKVSKFSVFAECQINRY